MKTGKTRSRISRQAICSVSANDPSGSYRVSREIHRKYITECHETFNAEGIIEVTRPQRYTSFSELYQLRAIKAQVEKDNRATSPFKTKIKEETVTVALFNGDIKITITKKEAKERGFLK